MEEIRTVLELYMNRHVTVNGPMMFRGMPGKGMRDSAGIVHEDAWVGANCEAVFVALD